MPTTTQVQNTLLTAQLKAANLTLANVTALQAGALSVSWGAIIKAQRGINSVQNRYTIGDLTSTTFNTAYACLTAFVGTYAGGAIDPNAQNPGTVINVTGGAGSKVNSNFFPFTNQTTVALDNYQSVYYPTYGNAPQIQIFVSDGAGGFTPDNGTAPDYQYVTAGVPSSGITSITWSYGAPVTGYIQIVGVQP